MAHISYFKTTNNIASKTLSSSALIAIFTFLVATLSGSGWLDSTAILIFVLSSSLLVQRLGSIIPVKELVFFLASLQWLLAPVLSYAGLSKHYKYYMYVDKSVYMPFAISGTLAFAIGLFLFDNGRQYFLRSYYLPEIISRIQHERALPYFLIVIGIASSFFASILNLSTLGFVFYLFSNVKYIGLIYLLFGDDKKKWLILSAAGFLTFSSSVNKGMFHELLLWVAFIGMYVSALLAIKLRVKLIAFTMVFLLMVSVIVVKEELRKYVWGGQAHSGSRIGLFFNLLDNKISDLSEDYDKESGSAKASLIHNIVMRINQGWIVSRIMYHIPQYQPYLHGESVTKAIYAGIFPRFIDPTKQTAGGQDYFERFTGYKLTRTSMGASLLGEGYANYGTMGALIFLFIIGYLCCAALNIAYKAASRLPTLLLWLPLLFLQVVKAETDLLRALNHLVKSAIFVVLALWILRKFYNFKL